MPVHPCGNQYAQKLDLTGAVKLLDFFRDSACSIGHFWRNKSDLADGEKISHPAKTGVNIFSLVLGIF